MRDFVSSIEACTSTGEVLALLNTFLTELENTRTDCVATAGPLPLRSAADIRAWQSALRDGAKQAAQSETFQAVLRQVDELLQVTMRKFDALSGN